MSGTANENTQASVERVKQEVERWIDVARTAGERTLEAMGLSGMQRVTQPAVDVLENNETVQVWVDVPGLSAEAVQLTTTETQLTVKLLRPDGCPTTGKFFLRERPHFTCERTVMLPASVKPEQTTAQLREGVLHVTLPKQHPTEARTVPVNVAT
jgi:HSP20 family protein